MGTRAVIYCRISRDAAHTGLGVERQRNECQAMCDQLGWDVVEVLTDNDMSASKRLRRPDYLRMLNMLHARSIDALVAWHPDRITRHPRELEDLIDALEAAKVKVRTVQSGEYDLSTASGRMTARVVGAVARHEAEHKSARQKAKQRELAANGRKSGGTRPFGYNEDQTIRESEAQLIRAAADEILAGATVRSIANRWNAAGVRGTRGAQWQGTLVSRMMANPILAGEHRSADGRVLGPGVWPPILDTVTHTRLRALLTDPARRTNRVVGSYLLTGGVARCGLCGTGLVARPRDDKRRCYVCTRDTGVDGCGKIRSLADPMEALVVDRLLDAANAGRLPGQVDSGDRSTQIVADLADLEGRKNELATDYYVNRTIDAGQFRTASERFTAEIGALQSELSAIEATSALTARRRDADTLEARWPELTFEERRGEIRAYIDVVVVSPAIKGNNRFQPDRFAIRFAA